MPNSGLGEPRHAQILNFLGDIGGVVCLHVLLMKLLAALSLPLILTACDASHDVTESSKPLTQDAANAIGVTRLLNDPSTSFEILDDDVALDRRAARNLIAHRDGSDGFYGTSDDDLFDDIAEADAVRYVGPSALAKLLAHAEANAYIPGPEDLLGRFDGVTFTFAEAESALQLCNNESEGVLDDEIGLDRRAVTSILDARPISGMGELASLYYVGGSALGTLKAYVAQPQARIDCRGTAECPSSEVCEGIPFDGSSEFGKCRPLANIPGVGDDCSINQPCGPNLFCGGLTFGGGGMCIGAWQQDTFVNTTGRFIPQQTPQPIATSVTVRGQATVPFDITVDIDLSHDDPHSLKIVLFDPNGTDAVLWDGPNEGSASFPRSFVALGNISRDDTVNGRWVLRITNESGSGLGTLHSWTLWLSSNFD